MGKVTGFLEIARETPARRPVVEGVGDHGCEYMTKGLVIVLSDTGKNFAAGMTGGIAYVLDETGEFSSVLCNKAGVDLEPLVDAADIQGVRTLIQRHVEYTGSPRAKWILENWGEMVSSFVKVYPHEYKRVLGVARSTSVYQPIPLTPAARQEAVVNG